jgi:hypothetical protein
MTDAPKTIERFMVGVVVERRKAVSEWVGDLWAPVQVLATAPDIAPMTSLGKTGVGQTGGRERFYLGPAEIALFKSDTAHFADNFLGDAPQLWVSIRPTGIEPQVELVGVTADPHEGEGLADQVGDVVEPLPMPPEIAGRVLAFYHANHVEQVFIKRKRHAVDPRKGGIRPRSGMDQAGSGGEHEPE